MIRFGHFLVFHDRRLESKSRWQKEEVFALAIKQMLPSANTNRLCLRKQT